MDKVWLLLPGLALLILGGEWLVRGASRLALALNIPKVIIGLTVVAFGTSAPELAVSVLSSYQGLPDISVGNVVGSNIVNILLILGLSAVVAPLRVSQRLVRTEVPLMIATALLFLALAYDGRLARGEGLLLLVAFTAYLIWMAHAARQDSSLKESLSVENVPVPHGVVGYLRPVVLIVAGLAGLAAGSNWLIAGAVALTRAMGISELVVGLTVVAIGTSLPELVTSVVASLRNERDISVGNVVGSNIFNILLIIGASAAIAPSGLSVAPGVLRFDAPVMIAVSLACLPIFFTDFQIKRWEGALFMAYYLFYVVYLFLHASEHGTLDEFTFAMRWFVLPFTVLALVTTFLVAWRRQGQYRKQETGKAD